MSRIVLYAPTPGTILANAPSGECSMLRSAVNVFSTNITIALLGNVTNIFRGQDTLKVGVAVDVKRGVMSWSVLGMTIGSTWRKGCFKFLPNS